MNCEGYRDALTDAALDGAAETMDARLRAHLSECTACREELQRLTTLAGAIDGGVSQMVSGDPSPGFAAGVRARIEEETEASAAWWRGWVPQLAGGLAALALIGWLAWSAIQSGAPGLPDTAEKKQDAPAVQPVPAHNPPAPQPQVQPVPPHAGTDHAMNRPPRAPRLPVMSRQQTPPLPEVLVAGDEWAQVVKLYNLLQRGADLGKPEIADATPLEEKAQPLLFARLEPIKPIVEDAPVPPPSN